MMTKEGSTKIVNFMTPLGLNVRRGHISHYYNNDYVLSSTPSMYNTLIAIVLSDYDAAYLFDR